MEQEEGSEEKYACGLGDNAKSGIKHLGSEVAQDEGSEEKSACAGSWLTGGGGPQPADPPPDTGMASRIRKKKKKFWYLQSRKPATATASRIKFI